jgi:hypothetical protein
VSPVVEYAGVDDESPEQEPDEEAAGGVGGDLAAVGAVAAFDDRYGDAGGKNPEKDQGSHDLGRGQAETGATLGWPALRAAG